MNPFSHFPEIKTEDILLRKITSQDLDALCVIYQNPNVFRYIPGDAKKSRETVRHLVDHFERDFRKGKELFLGICLPESPDQLIGVAEMFHYDPKVNMVTVGYRLEEQFWGKGYAARAMRALCAYLFDDIGINRIQAFVMPENPASMRVLEKCGFVREGYIRQGSFCRGKGIVDLVSFSLLKGELK